MKAGSAKPLSTQLRRGAGKVNRWLVRGTLESPRLPLAWARLFAALHTGLMGRAYALPLPQMRTDPRHILTRLLRPSDVMVDVGASTGGTVEIASWRVGRSGHVFAFEPQEKAYDELERKRRRFGWANVTAMRTLVGEASGEATLYQHPLNSEVSSLSSGWSPRFESVPVVHPMISLDDWASTHSVPRVDFIKIDVEGAELGVLRGARSLLAKHRPALLIEIYRPWRRQQLFGYTTDDLLEELRGRGYTRFDRLRRNGLRRFEAQAELDDADQDMLAR